MKSIFKAFILLSIILSIHYSSKGSRGSATLPKQPCVCDTVRAKEILDQPGFNRMEIYDNNTFAPDSLYSLSAEENKELWYRDIQNPDTTKFTRLWNDYLPTNYHADHLEFLEYFENRSNVELAFQFGPNMDLWAYHIFVLRKLECCYLLTRSYFRHARFTYKAYSIVDEVKVDSLYQVINSTNRSEVDTTSNWSYSGYFMDNRMNRKFFIDFMESVDSLSGNPTDEVLQLYDFVDNRINWKVTY